MVRTIEKNQTIERLNKWVELDILKFETKNIYFNGNIYEERNVNPWKYCNKRK